VRTGCTPALLHHIAIAHEEPCTFRAQHMFLCGLPEISIFLCVNISINDTYKAKALFLTQKVSINILEIFFMFTAKLLKYIHI
jgi:hypothetical protein